MALPSTPRGRATRERILASASRLFQERSVNATSVDDVLAAAGAGKGQFYRYFDSREQLVAAVVTRRLDEYLHVHREALERLESWEDLAREVRGLAAAHRERDLAGGCPVGGLALELSGSDERLRREMARAMAEWQESLAIGLRRLAERDELTRRAPPERLAAELLATVQGAYLLSTVHRDGAVMDQAVEQALSGLRPDVANPRMEPRNGTV